jgi:GMP synthase-like glutamine amidotransferase
MKMTSRADFSTTSRRTLRVCLVDMNAGHVNQAMRCLRSIVEQFFARAVAQNPGLACSMSEVSPRDTDATIPRDADLYLGSGGPGSPFDGDGAAWSHDFADFADGIAESASRDDENQRAIFGVCYSFELLVRHFAVATIALRTDRKFGVMPIYTTPDGRMHPLLSAFGERLFAFEHRNWEAVDVNAATLRSLGGRVLARESRDGASKGRAILGFDIAPGVEAVQFHPEADRAGVVNWVARPEQAAAFKATYGESTYQAMLRTLDDPHRLARTYALVIPGWLSRKFNALARHRGYAELAPPPESAEFAPAFATEASAHSA